MSSRYSRQMFFEPIGEQGQERLKNKHVLCIGLGALGSVNAENLVRSGVGELTIVDRDYVEISNLQRQSLYDEKDVANRLPKAIAAKQRLEAINSEVTINAYVSDVGVEELAELIRGVDLIIDSCDNFQTRFIINDTAIKYDIPWIFGACVGSYGLSFTIIPGVTPCLNCLLDSLEIGGATCDTQGIVNPVVHMVTAYQTTEALKLLIGDQTTFRSTLASFDLWKNEHSYLQVDKLKKESCTSCGKKRVYPYLNYHFQTKVAVLCGRNTVQISPPVTVERNFDDSERILVMWGGHVSKNRHLLFCSLGKFRLVLFKDGRVLIHGTSSLLEAKILYYQLLD
ncbi:ThiF family adenylyltransferase [Salipaludibacillus agaradhaerens]|uniref:ThiF family adenylyltransferase n=1 Tax=Salipaludibacillus agaradhaerens TaxID=76935 RepID=A0A9Q4FZ24_SALAG|nr:ThiF family adenylyltransferase [Salipaludibacillus agaradhaerens]MCR6096931.1 ThiF family adenylyltransferase [Salipaludibacillus agaradhaerens]MCR6113584.1 ThiF family adenylyltransferase [Salipaludibacillus agaradhaerens]